MGAIIGLGIWSALAFSDRDASKDMIDINLTEEEAKNITAETFAPRSAPIRGGLTQMSASAATTPTDWLHCDSTTTTTATTFHIRRDNVHGSRIREILDGRGASQSSTYTVIWLFKPTN